MRAIDFVPNYITLVKFHAMSRHCITFAASATASASLINRANPLSLTLFTPLLKVASPDASPFFSSSNVRATATMNKDGVDSPDLEAIFQQKRSLRSKMRKELKNMDPTALARQDSEIQNLVLGAPWFKASKSLCAYVSCPSLREVDTSRILSQVLASSGKKLYVPRVEDRNSNMRMLKISNVHDLVANSMNILEPAAVDSDGNQRDDVMQASEPVDLIVIPGLAFDRSGRRMGRGGGYYDKFLRKYQDLAKENEWKQPLVVALAYSEQIMDAGGIPVAPYDVPVDVIVAPAHIIPINPTAMERFD